MRKSDLCLRWLLVPAVLPMVLGGCGGGGGGGGLGGGTTDGGVRPSAVATRVSVSGASATTTIGGTVQFTASTQLSDGSSRPTTNPQWSSANENIATVSAGGMATGRAAGTTRIEAAGEGFRDGAELTVMAAVTVAEVRIAGGTTVRAGATLQLTATARMSDGTEQPATGATWRSADERVARVSSTGLVSGVNDGRTTIEASFQGRTGTVTMEVTEVRQAPVARFTVRGSSTNNVCLFSSAGGLDCTFDGSASSGGSGGRVTQWIWRYEIGSQRGGPTTRSEPTFVPETTCGFFEKPTSTTTSLNMIVRLQVRNADGELSEEQRNSNVSVRPKTDGACGFGF